MSKFDALGERIFKQKYAFTPEETWNECCVRVVSNVMSALPVKVDQEIIDFMVKSMQELKWLPAGRYLYSAGRPFHQTQNCLALHVEDSREGWSELLRKASMALMTGAGIGVDYSQLRPRGSRIEKTGGVASGPVSLMYAINDLARQIQQGGSRRSALLAQLNWYHQDVGEFIRAKNWSEDIKALKAKDFNFPAPLDQTNISVRIGDKFFKSFDANDPLTVSLFNDVTYQMCSTGEPGFIINVGEKAQQYHTNACQPASAKLLTPVGIRTMGELNVGDVIWSGKQWTKITKKWSTGVKKVNRYVTSMGEFVGTPDHKVVSKGEKIFVQEAKCIDTAACNIGTAPIDPQIVMDGIVLGDGSVHKASNNLVILYIGAKDQDYFSSEVSEYIGRDRSKAFANSEGTTVVEPKTTITAAELVKTYDRVVPDRFYKGNASVVASFLRGLFTANGCVTAGRVNLRTTSEVLAYQVVDMLSYLGIRSNVASREPVKTRFANGEYLCRKSYNINLYRDSALFMEKVGFIQEYKNLKEIKSPQSDKYVGGLVTDVVEIGEEEVFDITVEAEEHTYWTGGLLVSNCSEFRSVFYDNACNLGSINLANVRDIDEFTALTEAVSLFLYAGTYYSDLPYLEVNAVRDETRQIGLGLMGVHEWFINKGLKYGEWSQEFEDILKIYEQNLDMLKPHIQGLKLPAYGRAIAPTGTLSIVAATTGGIEPCFATAYKRRYLKGSTWHYQYQIEAVAKRLIESGVVKENDLEDAYSIDYERRIAFQAYVQKFVDQAISSTVNLPAWGSEYNNESTLTEFRAVLRKYLKQLRGITTYPDASRGGQPLTPVKYSTALKYLGEERVEITNTNVCDITGAGCGG